MKQEITTSGGTYVVTFTQAGTVEADRNNRTYILATASEAGQVAFKAISDSVIISDDNAILTAEDFVFAPGPILKPTSGGGGTLGAYVTWGGENNTEVTVNVPDDVDLPLSFYERRITKATLKMGGTTKMSNFFYSCPTLEELSIIAPHVENISYFLWGSKITSINWSFPSATNCDRLCPNNERVITTKLDLPNATVCNYLIYRQTRLNEAWINAPKATKVQAIFGPIPVITLSFNLASVATFDLTVADPVNNNQLGRLASLQNLTILDGGLASCTAFNISVSTALTDASIQNIIDALPDYSGTQTSALVSFPPDRLTTEQQEQLAAKNWTWS